MYTHDYSWNGQRVPTSVGPIGGERYVAKKKTNSGNLRREPELSFCGGLVSLQPFAAAKIQFDETKAETK